MVVHFVFCFFGSLHHVSSDMHHKLRFRKTNCKKQFWDCFASFHLIRQKVRWPPAVCIPLFSLSLSFFLYASLFSSLALALSLPVISVTQSTSVRVCVCVSLSLSLTASVQPREGTPAKRERDRERERERETTVSLSRYITSSLWPSPLLTNPFQHSYHGFCIVYVHRGRLEWEGGRLLVTEKTQEIQNRVLLLGMWMVEMYCNAETIVYIARNKWLFRNSALFVYLLFYAQKLERLSSRRHLRWSGVATPRRKMYYKGETRKGISFGNSPHLRRWKDLNRDIKPPPPVQPPPERYGVQPNVSTCRV